MDPTIRLPAEPCQYSRSPWRQMAVGVTYGWPSRTQPTWPTSAASRIASIVARSYRPRSGFRRRRTRSVAGPADSLYRARLERCLTAVNEQERNGPDPDWVARVVVELSRERRVAARRPVGEWARAMCALLRLVPDRVRERVVASRYRLR